ncbi:MAG: DEAD/DEAH box helicase, partial [Pyrinomonadaceae bacterium]
MTSTAESATVLGSLLRRVVETEEFRRLITAVEGGARVISIGGLSVPSARALALAALQRETRRSFALVVEAGRDLETWERDVRVWHAALGGEEEGGESRVLVLPASEIDPFAGVSPHAETMERRALTLWQLAHAGADFVLLPARALARRTVTVEQLKRAGAILRRDEDYAPETLVEKLIASGYVREDPVRSMGAWSLRGGILDVWSPGNELPVRVEFFGDTVDSIREFDPETQLSTRQLRETAVRPMRELTVTAEDLREWAERARGRWRDERFERALLDRTEFADAGETFAGWEWLIGLSQETQASAFDYLPDAVLVVDEPGVVERSFAELYETLARRYAETDAADEIGLRPEELYLSVEELREKLDEMQRVELRTLGRAAARVDESFAGEAEEPQAEFGKPRASSSPLFLFPSSGEATEVELRARAAPRYHGRIPDLARDVQRRRNEAAATTLFAMPSAGLAERVAEMLADYEVNVRLVLSKRDMSGDALQAGGAIATLARLSHGFELPEAQLIVHTESDLFDEVSTDAPERRATTTAKLGDGKRRSKTAAFLSDFRDLKPGDFVVHIDHGIARFNGLQTLDLGRRKSEFMLLTYADDAKLYVPVERLDLVQRYSSAEGHEPTLDRLGGLGWQKTKAKAKRAMRDMADELLRLYAERKLVRGYAFPTDTPWQRELEDSFEYEPTPDQATAIEDVKRDMETPSPMDRLLCGDVGYGKTEVAMRAAFKAVMDSKQVAVLTPTTVLAYQHFETMKRRFAAFPVRVELLSRFRTTKEQKTIVEQTERGEVDILVGTHRILSKDLRFRDLGLVVVDEEQRFGVAHKERLKQLKKRVDVLTLSATPIPRTLNMSLMGVRDMSVIETPPRDRLSINTQVVQFSES